MSIVFSLIQNLLPATCLSLFCVSAALGKKQLSTRFLLAILAVCTLAFSVEAAIWQKDADQSFEIFALSLFTFVAPLSWIYLEHLKANSVKPSFRVIFGILLAFVLLNLVIIVSLLTPQAAGAFRSLSEAKRVVTVIISALICAEACVLLYNTVTSFSKLEESLKRLFICFAVFVVLVSVRAIPFKYDQISVVMNLILTGVILYTVTLAIKLNFQNDICIIPSEEVDTNESIAPVEISTEDTVAESRDEESKEDVNVPSTVPLSPAAQDSLRAKFENYVITQQNFLKPGLTMGDVAKDIKTNRTYVSQLVNQTYNMTFPEFLNNLRIDYAEQFILHNRNASQQEVAQACGFPSASSFNVTFKKITGVTPRIWLATYSKN